VLYEKDGTWVLEKIPDDIKDELKNQDADKDGSCKNQGTPSSPVCRLLIMIVV